MRIFDRTLTTLERALDVRLSRQTALAANLANVDTPGFVPRDVDFAAAMGAGAAADPALPAAPGPGAPGDLPLTLAAWSPPTAGAPGLPPPAGPPGTLAGLASPAAGPATAPGIDGNAVDADRALVAIAENALQYGAAAKAVSKKLAILRYVASDGTA